MSAKAARTLLASFTCIALAIPMAVQSASAVTPLISVKPMALIVRLDPAENPQGLLVKKGVVYAYGTKTVGGETSDGFIRAFDASGAQLWSLALDTGGDDIATAAGLDPFGNIWVAGSSALPNAASDASSSIGSDISAALNPDSVTVVTKIPLRGDPNLVTTWLISPKGELLSTSSQDVGRSILVRGISASATTVSIVGIASTALGSAGFFIQSTRKGVFGKIALIGKRDTEFSGIVKSGKNLFLIGSSSETLFNKPRSGIRDAMIATYSSSGNFLSILRSFNTGATRSWQSGGSTYFFGGDVVTGDKSEAVVTKYSSTFLPLWTARFESAGPAVITGASPLHFATFASQSAISGVKSWRPIKAQLIALLFEKTGGITEAFSAKGLVSPISAGFSLELGAVIMGRGVEGVSIFHTVTR